MKKLKGMSLLLTLVLLGAVISVIGGTLAYIVAHTDPIVNTFQLGDITYELKLYPNPPALDKNVVMPGVTPSGDVDTDVVSGVSEVAAGSVTFTLSGEPTLEGYEFTGWWFKTSQGGYSQFDTANPQTTSIEVAYNVSPANTSGNKVSLELYARWEPITYTIVYDDGVDDDNGITGSTASSTHTYDVEKDLTKNGYVRQGYTFNGWKDESGKSYTDEESVVNLTIVPNGTVKLTAQWDAKSYIIRYHANGGTGSMADQTIKYDVPTQLKENAFTKSDYSFMGWALSETGEVKYIDKQEVVNLLESGTLDLYAVWAQDTHTVTFDYNGGTGSPASKQFQNGKAYGQLPEYPVHPTKTISETEIMSYLFTGWYTEPTGGTRVYPTDIANRTDDHTLYAHWEEAPTNNVIKDIVVKNNPDDNKDGVADDIYINLKCSSSFEKYNIPLENLVVGQTYKLTYTTSNDASFGDYITGYKNSVYGSYIMKNKELTGGRIDTSGELGKDYFAKDLLATWNDREEPDGNNDGSQKATNDAYLNGPWKNRTITFTAQATTMYWTWDFGLIEDGIAYNFNITDIVLEPVVPVIEFNKKEVIKGGSSAAYITSQTNDEYSSTFTFDGDGGCETVYYPITGLTVGSTYTIIFAHTFSGPLIHDTKTNSTPTYEYGCGIMNAEPTKTGDKMTSLGTWASDTFVKETVDGKVDNKTLTFTATGDTAYWVWNMANCSDSTNCTTKIEVTTFSATHSGGSITYHSATPTLSVVEIAEVLESPEDLIETEELPVETEELPVETEELPVETEELPIETEELPVETEELPVETEELPTETEELGIFTAEKENPVLGGGETPAEITEGGAQS